MSKSTEQLIQEVKALKGLGCPAEQKVLIDLVLAMAEKKTAKAAEPINEEKTASVSTFKKLVGGGKK